MELRPGVSLVGLLLLLLLLLGQVHSLTPSDIKLVAAIGNLGTPPASGLVDMEKTHRDLWIQAKELVRHLKENPQLDFKNDWKLINVFFSNISQCHLCPSAQQKRHLMKSMEKLCEMLDYLHQEETWEGLLASRKFNNHESFTVVFQPFFYEVEPSSERSSSQDPSMLALRIWNNMMKPVGDKDELFDASERERLECPSQVREGTEFSCLDQDPSDTVPNTDILREFNPSLKGFSVGTGRETTANAFFNQAVAGAKAEDLTTQAQKLVSLMRADTTIDFENDWKIITVFIGGNDLCASCNDLDHYSPQNFTDNIKAALDILHAEVPRAFVNMVKVLEIIGLRDLYKETKVSCPRLILRSLCPCVLKFDDNSTEFAALVERNRQYQEGTEQLIESGRYDTRDDFTVVLQPFLENVAVPRTPLEPVGHKTREENFEIKLPIMCPNQAGNGIRSQEENLSDLDTQYRGLSYSAGGDASLENVTTLPNILREFNENLTGYAVGTGDANSASAFLNQAVPRAKAENLVSQVQTLVEKMKNDHRVNFFQDWKVITVMIGASDLCDFCMDTNRYSAANFSDHLRNALDILHREVPRALVNLVDFMNPSVIRQVFLKNPDKCPVHQASVLCNCVLSPGENSQELGTLKAFSQSYQNSMRQLVESGRYDTREDFSVVLQPLFRNAKLPILENGQSDTSFFAPDCILPNQKFHSLLSRALWANMDEPFLRTFRNSNYTYPSEPAIENWGSDFLCTTQSPSSSVPSSVHELRPADIKVVAALGDSVTEAASLCDFDRVTFLFPSIGGDGTLETHTTLPNILKKFNPSILGFSTGTLEETAGLNMAREGARAQDMPAQAKALVEKMKATPTINLKEDWKLVTLFVGGNDLCHYCENSENQLVDDYIKHIQQALDILYKELPRVFINVVEVMELAGLYQGEGGKCAMPLAVQNCSCFERIHNPKAMQELKKVNWNFQSGISGLSYWPQYMQREDFAAVVQPFFRQTLIPLTEQGDMDLTVFSEDCFHFSERGHAEMAIALWNNMLEPVGRKTTSNNFTHSRTKLKCPSPESPFLYTLRSTQLLPAQQAEASSKVLTWAVPVAAVGGLVVGILGMMLWRAMRRPRMEAPSTILNATHL
ncbi:Phospholipase B1, membrane-associated [Microtus ochrogaster]|uniref:Phospholipase B1, membrane-associated n=1 Tax=Microtus ochrogaster TaxID=79684 RepID=A0A8J6KPQ9_MICOH|nr:Phospholipase B1, membrane-associated [Microtus ochrogaster]